MRTKFKFFIFILIVFIFNINKPMMRNTTKLMRNFRAITTKINQYPTLKKYTTIGIGLWAAGTICDHFNDDTILDVNTLNAQPIQEDNDTKNNISEYELSLQTWIFLKKFKQQFMKFVYHINQQKSELMNSDDISCVHGTTQGATILMRTILNDTLNGTNRENFLDLRDRSTIEEIKDEKNSQEFYSKRLEYAPRVPWYANQYPGFGIGGGTGRTGIPTIEDSIVLFDKGAARRFMVSANNSLMTGNSWVLDGFAESSLEFLSEPASWLTSTLIFLHWFKFAILHNPSSFKHVIQHIQKNGMPSKLLPILKNETKGFDDSDIMENIFAEYDAEPIFAKYKDELNEFKYLASAGLVHFIIKGKAKNWCYVSRPLGLMVPEYNVNQIQQDPQLKHEYQVRIILHPDLAKYNPDEQNTLMKLYLFANQEKINHMLQRMNEIANEVKEYKNKQ